MSVFFWSSDRALTKTSIRRGCQSDMGLLDSKRSEGHLQSSNESIKKRDEIYKHILQHPHETYVSVTIHTQVDRMKGVLFRWVHQGRIGYER